MRGFKVRWEVSAAFDWIDRLPAPLGAESIPAPESPRRVLASAVVAPIAIPAFDRAAMDGYAVRGEETFGCDRLNPACLRVIGESRPGAGYSGVVHAGEAVRIMTGAPLPAGADAVVKVESTRDAAGQVQITEPTPPGRHVGRRGEDVLEGATILEAGRVLRPQDQGLLSAIGARCVSVVRRPAVAVLTTGDELLPIGAAAVGARFPDMNAPMLAALVARDEAAPRLIGPLADQRETLRAAIADAAGSSDVVLIAGGSSTGIEDHAPGILAELGELCFHGFALRPASPTGLGRVGNVPVVLLPGNPVSCLCAYDFFGGRIIRRLGSRKGIWPYQAVERPLAEKLVSALGRVDYARVRLKDGAVEPLATSGASILSSTTRADGFVVVPANVEGYPPGDVVTVWLYDLP